MASREDCDSGTLARSVVATALGVSTPQWRAVVASRMSSSWAPWRRAEASVSMIRSGAGTWPTFCRRRRLLPRLRLRLRFCRAAAVMARRASETTKPHAKGVS